MAGEADLVGLLHRADWTRLSMSAQVSDGSTVLIAPGRRYRYQAGEYVTGCDGDRPWELSDEDADDVDGSVHWISGPEPPIRELLCPAWLLESSRLEVRGPVRACGRDALDVVVTRRPSVRRKSVSAGLWSGPVEVLVDAELGFLLRLAKTAGGVEPEVTELVGADFDPVTDPAQFRPPPGSLIAEGFGEALGAGGPVWWAAKTAAGLAAGGLGAWIRYSPFRYSQPVADAIDVEAAIPGEDPAPDLTPGGSPAGPPVSDDVLALLHQGGPGAFTATLHEWMDLGAMASQTPAAARRAGFGGLGLLLDAVSEQPAATRLISALRVAGPGRYQIDHAYQPRRGPKTFACDGQHLWQVYDDKITTGPAEPLPGDIGDLADPSWLLGCRLSGGTPVMADDRPAYRINVARGQAEWSFALMFPAAVAVIDAELGIVLRLTSYIGAKPVRRHELRDITTSSSDFQVDLPAGLPTVEATVPFDDFRHADPPNIAGQLARHAAAEAAKAARNLCRRFDTREPHNDV